jgi:hypothetical protein
MVFICLLCVFKLHFDANQYENHRQDKLVKLKPNAVPTVFNASLCKPCKRRRLESSAADDLMSVNPLKSKTTFYSLHLLVITSTIQNTDHGR